MGAVAGPHREAEDRVPGKGAARRLHAAPRPHRDRPGRSRRTTPICWCRRRQGAVPRGGGRLLRRARPASARARPTTATSRYQLAKRGFVALSLGSPPARSTRTRRRRSCSRSRSTPTSRPTVTRSWRTCRRSMPKRIGVVGHSYGGKWAMFASCLYDKFACAVWSDPGIVFDEKRSNVNYWEPWYLGYEPGRERKPGIPDEAEPAHRRLQAADRGRPRPARAARPDGAAAVPGLRRLGGRAGALEGAQPRRRGQRAAGRRRTAWP